MPEIFRQDFCILLKKDAELLDFSQSPDNSLRSLHEAGDKLVQRGLKLVAELDLSCIEHVADDGRGFACLFTKELIQQLNQFNKLGCV